MDAKKLSTKLGLALLLTLIIPHAFSSELPLLEGRRLRPMVIDKYPAGNVYIGGTTGGRKRPAGSGLIMDREPSYVTPENDFKQSRIHPRPDVWNWKEANVWVEHYQKQQSDSRKTESEPGRVYDLFVSNAMINIRMSNE